MPAKLVGKSSDPTSTLQLSRSDVDARHSHVAEEHHEGRRRLAPVVDHAVGDHTLRSRLHDGLRAGPRHGLRRDLRDLRDLHDLRSGRHDSGQSGSSRHDGRRIHDHHGGHGSLHGGCRRACLRIHGPIISQFALFRTGGVISD